MRTLRPIRQPRHPPARRAILVLLYAEALGYNVHITPLFEALHQAGLTVIVATHGANLALLRNSPFVDHLIATSSPFTSWLSCVRTLRRELRLRHLQPDATLTGTADRRTRIALLGTFATPAWQGGFTEAEPLYRRPIRYDPDLSRLANNLRLAELVSTPESLAFNPTQQPSPPTPRVFFSPQDLEHAHRLLAPFSARPILAVIAANSGGLPTAWHDARWVQVLQHAHRTLGLEIIYLGAPVDSAAIDRLRALTGGLGTSLAGQTTIPELAAVLSLSDCALAIMTGAMHVARAVSTPVVVLAPSWETPLEWLTPLEPHVRLLRGETLPNPSPSYRLDELTAEDAIAALTLLLAGFPPSAHARQARVNRSLSAVDRLEPRAV